MGTDFLYAKPSFLGGMGSAMDLGATLVGEYNRSATPSLADYRALRSDWAISGMEIFTAMKNFNAINHGSANGKIS
jgi:hypothetical protein